MAIKNEKSPELKAKEAALREAIAAKYGDTAAQETAAPAPSSGRELSIYERAAADVVVQAPNDEGASTGDSVPAPAPVPAPTTVPTPALAPGPDATLLARLASMDAELAELRKAKRAQSEEAPRPGPASVVSAREFYADPVAALAKLGVPEEHVARHLVYKTMGPDKVAPDIAASVNASRYTGAVGAEVSALTARLDELSKEIRRRDYHESLEKSVTGAEATKYPHLVRARAANADAINKRLRSVAALSDSLSPDEVMQRVEADLAEAAAFFMDKTKKSPEPDTQEKNDVPAMTATALRGGAPRNTGPKTWLQSEAEMRAELKAKYSKTP